MTNQSKKNDPRFWKKWKESGAIGTMHGQDFGEAYAFFNCKAPLTEIAQEIPTIRALVQTPRRLELCLAERALPLFGDDRNSKHASINPELAEIALYANDTGIKYVLAARSPPNITNRQTADELSAILNQAYQSPLYADGEEFRGEIVYKEDNHYVFRE